MRKNYRRRRPGLRKKNIRWNNKAGKGGRKFAYRGGKNGSIKIIRKLPELAIASSGTAGTATLVQNLNAGAPVCITLGTPSVAVGSSGTAISYDVPFSLQFSLNQLINHTDITNLCDKYKVLGAYVRFYYNHTGASGASTYSQPYLQYITDHDDSNVPTIAQLREKMGVKLKTFKNQSSYVGMKVKPVPNRQIYSSALVNGYEIPKYCPWLDCATDAVPMYGIKGVISNMNLPATAGIEVMKVDVALVVVGKDIQ